MVTFVRTLGIILLLALCGDAAAQKPPKNEVKGQGQMSGIYGKFGEVYTMQSGFNLSVYSIACQIEPYVCYGNNGIAFPQREEKLVVIQFGLKNTQPQDHDFGDGAGYFTLVSSSGEKYESAGLAFQSSGSQGVFLTLKPGQGAGTPEMKDPLRMMFVVPLRAKIEKIIVKEGRKSEQVLRFLLAGSDPAADPKNVLKPLPDSIRDPAEKSGCVGLPEASAKLGDKFVSGGYSYTVSGTEKFEGEKFVDEFLDEGKCVWTVSLTISGLGEGQSLFEAISEANFMLDEDGERHTPLGLYKGKADEIADLGRPMPKGEAYSVRLAFVTPKNSVPKTLSIASNTGIVWKIDLKKP